MDKLILNGLWGERRSPVHRGSQGGWRGRGGYGDFSNKGEVIPSCVIPNHHTAFPFKSLTMGCFLYAGLKLLTTADYELYSPQQTHRPLRPGQPSSVSFFCHLLLNQRQRWAGLARKNGILKNESSSSIHLVGAVDRQSFKKRKAVFSLNEFSFTFSTKAEENHLSPLTSEHFKPLTAAEIDTSPLTVKHH